MPAKKVMKTIGKKKLGAGRLSRFMKGIIFGMFLAGLPYSEIADETDPPKSTVGNTVATCEARGGMEWDGDYRNPNIARRGFQMALALQEQIRKLVFKLRGSVKVTAAVVMKKLPKVRTYHIRTIQRVISAAGLAWLARRRKTWIPEKHKKARLAWWRWIHKQTPAFLKKFAYTDGTVFYIARTETEHGDKKRLALGRYVWRMAEGSDALFEECIGPSVYAKAQGKPVRVWGLLANGMLFVHVFPEGTVMNRWEYEWLLNHRFPPWLRKAFGPKRSTVHLVQDHEKALWCDEPLAAMDANDIHLLRNYPKCSQDLNPAETAWRELRARLDETMPTKMETRGEFIARLRNAVSWLNSNRADYFMKICNSQVEWADDVKAMKGGRAKH